MRRNIDSAALVASWRYWARPEQLEPEGDWLLWAILAGRGWGKALRLSTPLPTPTGWTTIAQAEPGTVLLDERGEPCAVTATFDVPHPERAWRVEFSDGSSLVACGDHQWVTLDHLDRKRLNRSRQTIPADWATKPPISTDELAATLRQGPRGDLEHCVPMAAPLPFADVDLPLDPYLLGLWLGDGDSRSSCFTALPADMDHYRSVVPCTITEYRTKNRWRLAELPDGTSVHSRLREMGLLGAKRIPDGYLRSGYDQRLALLRGLMDTDGYLEPSKAEFTTIHQALAEQVLELVRTLGEKPRVYEGHSTIRGRIVSPKFRGVWRPQVAPTSLPRKAFQPPGSQAMRNTHRMVTEVAPVTPEPMRCLTVDSPHAMFLAGRAMIPTHNTRTGAEWCVDRAMQGYERGALIGTTASHIRDVMVEGESGLGEVCERRKIRYKYEPSKRRVTLQPRGPWSQMQYTGYSAEKPDLLAGPSHDTIWGDEPGSWAPVTDGAGRTTHDNAMFGLRLSLLPRACYTTTPRARELIRLLASGEDRIHLTQGTLYENLANLAQSFIDQIVGRYEGTRLGDQEILGLLLESLGKMFRRSWWLAREDGTHRMVPADDEYGVGLRVRYWDLAGTPDTGDNDPDWTAGVLLTREADRKVWEHLSMTRDTPGKVEELVVETARADPPGTIVYIEQDPGQAGKAQVAHYKDLLAAEGIACDHMIPSGPKATRAELPSTEGEAGRLWMREGSWNHPAWDQLEEFPDGSHDDIVDALSGAVAAVEKAWRAGGKATGTSPAQTRLGQIARPGSRTGLRIG